MDVAWLPLATSADPPAVGVSRSHGCCCGRCVWGTGDTNLEAVAGETSAQEVCPVKAAARQVCHCLHFRSRLGLDEEVLPLCPSLEGQVVTKPAVA